MHLHEALLPATVSGRQPQALGLDFLWLELTNRCNLRCVHCYTESSPHSGGRDFLTRADYSSLMRQAHELGCDKLQFIGGEPQLNRHFHELMVEAKTIGFGFVEVYSNLTMLDDKTIRFAADNGVCFATSVYADEPDIHDAITTVPSSHAHTIVNLKKLIGAGIATRAGIVVINQDPATVKRTRAYLKDLGVGHVSSGATRQFGRGMGLLKRNAELAGLCGHCWSGKLCVAPDGEAYPCVMARQWPVGNVLQTLLAEIVESQRLAGMRRRIFDEVWQPKMAAAECFPQACIPDKKILCVPDECGPAAPCDPEDKCSPNGECEQSCRPDNCQPACPQLCKPNSPCAPWDDISCDPCAPAF